MSERSPTASATSLIEWMENGGTLVRFASSRLLATGNDPDLLPVPLRLGERLLAVRCPGRNRSR